VAECPACRRPVAMVRAGCLYCGAALPAEAVAAAAESAAASVAAFGRPPPVAAASPGTLLIVDQGSADPATLGAALGLVPYEAVQRHRRAGYALEGIFDEAAAGAEASRLRAAGLVVFLVPESLARAEPWLAIVGMREKDGLRLRGTSGWRQVSRPDILLVVRGPIVREQQAPFVRRKIQTIRLEDGYRFHLHLASSPQILELDPGNFDFGAQAREYASSLLEMSGWLEALAHGGAIDDAFRHSTPALGPQTAGTTGPLAAADALSRSASRGRSKNEATVHDNLRQFRFYSSWRGAVERAKTAPS
jgi:hypothetical protein